MKFIDDLFTYKPNCTINGLTNELDVFYVNYLSRIKQNNILVVTNSLYEANNIYESLKNYNEKTYLFPMDDFLTSVAIAMSPDLKLKRLETLNEIAKNSNAIVITNLMGYLRYLPKRKVIDESVISLKKNITINRKKMLELLDTFGYVKESLTTTTGEYSVRGFVIDIFPINENHPIRIELFGDEIDSIRYFSEDTQRTIEEISSLNILPNKEIVTTSKSNLLEYLQNPTTVFFDYQQILNGYQNLIEEVKEYILSNKIDQNIEFMNEFNALVPKESVYINKIDNYQVKNSINYISQEIIFKDFDINNLGNNLEQLLKEQKTVIIALSSDSQIQTIKKLIPEAIITSINTINSKRINIVKTKINKGFVFKDYAIVTENELFSNKTVSKYKNSMRIGKKIKDFAELTKGDYVVHSKHGVGVYYGVITLTKNGLKKDYIQINYKDNDKIYIPVEKISTVYKYTGKDSTPPKIDRLNSISWQKAKAQARKRIHDISEELIKLYAQRSNVKGIAFKDYAEEVIFGEEFKYELTDDQSKTSIEINNDLLSPVPMDRLLCGDVGFGKTEVAFRAIFKAILNNTQVLYLCPTTILSSQQYKSAIDRFKNWPIEIGLLNRFTTKKEAEKIVTGLKSGRIDLVFGTHRLLSEDIKPAKLGLLVVDEEQRFGVTHKEKIKKMKNDVNVLTLSATPIPRTLKMSLSGLRDLSVIDTPPKERYPIQTYVLPENDQLIKDAIYKELTRKGQIFILYNQVQRILDKAKEISLLVPEARVAVAHGQMSKTELEDIMADFIDHKFDILLCTTIIETGIDIQNANTLIIIDADRFGLSQLYQIRGRVGRSNKIAYAYLMYKKSKVLTETAVKRLEAIKEFTELGSGYKIAMRDLAIRGSGDILGSEQAGFIDAVGLDLYMQMMDEEMRRLNGEEIKEDERNSSLINVDTHISDDYVSDEDVKIEIHKLINNIKDYATLIEIKTEIEDRFGRINENLLIYMYEEWFEKLAIDLNITKVTQSERLIEITLPPKESSLVNGEKLFVEAYKISPKIRLKYIHKEICIALPLINLEKHFLIYLIPFLEKIKSDINNHLET